MGPQGVQGSVGPPGPQGEIGPSSAYFTGPANRVDVIGAQATPTLAAKLSFLPAGSYLVFARATAANPVGAGDAVRCNVSANGAPSPTSSIAVGNSPGFAAFGDISVAAPVGLPTQFNLEFACYHDQAGQSPYLEAIQLSAIRLGGLDVR